ncbi:Adenylate/cytidylate kinase [Giardia duodenalis assemblage B]|uniref:Adenylate/cytidylate kinase n=2 Tax=Giardia intestinalis TaxID=5741 RepID=A0A132NVG3_GIAIN|nr:Adenylate/cytidylate kinase [Giardia intestinalis]KWX14047.1 Adenylate/cytidylate kinase [Giardia intestinalis assemblage B]
MFAVMDLFSKKIQITIYVDIFLFVWKVASFL